MKKIKRQLRLVERWLSDFLRYPAHTFAHADKNSATFKYEISLKQAIQNNQGIENKLFNLRLAASKINEVIIRPGQTFSFWRIIGSPDQHYQKSRAIIGGKLVEDNGGGLCQICSAIYHISLIAGLEIVERHSHSIDIYSDTTRFTPLGTDATIVYGYKDLRIRNNKPDAIELMQKKVADIGNMKVFVAKTTYPQGAEKTLIKRVMGRIVPSGGLPADVGVVVDNISTVKAISDAIQTGMPLVERVATVTGEKIKNPGNFVIKIGTSVRELIDYCGGFTDDDVLVKMGGPMMGFPLNTLDVPMMKGSNGIIAVEPDETKEQPCIKCGRCVDVCPMELSPLYFVKYAKDENWQGMKDMNVMDCVECRCCQYICSSKIPIINSIKAGKNAVRGMK